MDHRLRDIKAIIAFIFFLSKISIFHDTVPAGFKTIILATSGFCPRDYMIFFWVSSLPDGCWVENPCRLSKHSGVAIGRGCSCLNLPKQISITVSCTGGPQSASFPLGLESLHFLWRFFSIFLAPVTAFLGLPLLPVLVQLLQQFIKCFVTLGDTRALHQSSLRDSQGLCLDCHIASLGCCSI